jgi:uncharacterized protein YtpQ (UPF0354 family)
VTQDQVHAQALVNLAELANRSKLSMKDYGGFYGLTCDTHFEASLILLDQLWDKSLAPWTPNGAVAALPKSDILAFCDAANEAAQDELRTVIERFKDGDHPISTALFRRVGKAWQPLDPVTD